MKSHEDVACVQDERNEHERGAPSAIVVIECISRVDDKLHANHTRRVSVTAGSSARRQDGDAGGCLNNGHRNSDTRVF